MSHPTWRAKPTLDDIPFIQLTAEGGVDESSVKPCGKFIARPCFRLASRMDDINFHISLLIFGPDLHLLEHRDPWRADIEVRNSILVIRLGCFWVRVMDEEL